MELHVPMEIIHQILSDIHEVEAISSLNLVCKEFATILQPRQFATVDLQHTARAQALAALCVRKKNLLSETITLIIGSQYTDIREAEELWAFLSTDTGRQLMRSININTLQSVSLSSLSPDLESSPVVLQSLALLGQGGQVSKLSVWNSEFSHVSKLCAVIDLLRTVRELDLESNMGFEYISDTEDASDTGILRNLGDGMADVESVIVRRIRPWDRAGATFMDSLREAGRLDSVREMTAYCGSYLEALALPGFVTPIAETLRYLIIQNPTQLSWSDRQFQDHLEFPTMPCLENLRLIGFEDSFVEWLVACVGPALLPSKSVIWSMALITSSKGGIASEHIFRFQ